jgi:alpha-galactosidase
MVLTASADFLETMFEVLGVQTMSFIDSRTEMTFWSLWSAPLIVATDIRNMTAQKASILTNPEVLAIDDEPSAGDLIANNTDRSQVWAKPLQNGDVAIVLFNAADKGALTVSADFAALGVGWGPQTRVKLRDLWARQDLGVFVGAYNATVAPHDVSYVRGTVVADGDE